MTLRRIRADLTSAKFPFNFSELSSTVVYGDAREIPKTTPPGFSGAEAEQQSGVCQAYYMENVIPIARGYSSVHFTEVIPEIPEINGKINRQYVLRSQGQGIAWLVLTDSGQYIYDSLTAVWNEVQLSNTTFEELYIANVKGATYIHIVGSGVYQYNFTDQTITEVEILGLDIGEMRGMAGVGALIVFWDNTGTIYNSSIYNPLDFVPSLATGAGSTSVLAITTDIITIESLGDDFIIYCKVNAIGARSTGDVQFPFVYEEIVGSEGIAIRDHVAANTNAGLHIIWTGSGFQSITVQQAEYIWPELRDGICRGLDIRLDPLLERPMVTYTKQFDLRLQFCTNNYACISLKSFEDDIFKQAYIYDQNLRRWGRLVVDHEYIIENPILAINGMYTYEQLESDYVDYGDLEDRDPPILYRDIEADVTFRAPASGINFAVVTNSGAIFSAAPSEADNFVGTLEGLNTSLPRIFLGRYKFTRDEAIQIQQLNMHRLHNGRIVMHGHLYSGAYVNKSEIFTETLEQPGHWAMQCSADSVSLEVNGKFTLTDVQLNGITLGANFAYGVPPRKKFFDYINSMPYPAYVVDGDMQSNVYLEGGELKEIIIYFDAEPDFLSSELHLVDGEMRDINITYIHPVEDFLYQECTLVSGSLRDIVITYTHTPEDFMTQSISLDSSDMYINGLYLTAPVENSIAQSLTLVSGTLS